MKKIRTVVLGAILACGMIGHSGEALAEGGGLGSPGLVVVEPKEVFAPPGFDDNDNDNAQLVVAGSFPSNCCKAGPLNSTVDIGKKEIRLRSEAYFQDNCWCLFVEVPFQQTVDLGVLPSGDYKVRAATRDGGHRAENAIEVLPVAEMRQGETCRPLLRPFRTQVRIQGRDASGMTLVHFRSLNGQAVNKVIDR